MLFFAGQLGLFGQSGEMDRDFNAHVGAPSGDRNFVSAIALQRDGKVIIGGRFETVDGIYRYRIARLNQDGSRDATFPYVDPDNVVLGMVTQPDDKIVFVGDFATVGGIPRGHVARLHSDGSLDAGFSATLDNVTTAVAVQQHSVLVGGVFYYVDGFARPAIARLNSDGSLDHSFVPGGISIGSDCRALCADAQWVYAAGAVGNFSAVARFHFDGSRDTNFFRYSAPNIAKAIAVQTDGKALVGSSGDAIRINTDGTLDSSFQRDPGPNGYVLSIAVQADGKILMAGAFTTYHGVPANRIVRLNTNGTVDLTFSASADTNVNAVAVQPDGKVLIAGEFQNVNGTPRTLVARLLGDFPVLRSIPSGPNELTLSWPTAYTNYVLETAPALPWLNWQPVAISPVSISNNWVVTNDVGPGDQFFRLRKE